MVCGAILFVLPIILPVIFHSYLSLFIPLLDDPVKFALFMTGVLGLASFDIGYAIKFSS